MLTALRSLVAALCLSCIVATAASQYEEEIVIADRRIPWFEVQPGQSEIRILVYRAGLLKGFGHNHVIASRDIHGNVWLDDTPEFSGFSLGFPVNTLSIDDPALRDEEGDDFPGEVPAKDIRDTRENMLGSRLLDAQNHVEIRLESDEVTGVFPKLDIKAEVTVREQTHSIRFPATVKIDGDKLTVSGTARISHADVGLEPFSAALGTIRVADEMLIRYRIVALRAAQD